MSDPIPAVRLAARLSRPAPLLIIFGFSTALLYRLTIMGEALYWGDIFLYFQPLYEHVGASLRGGGLPLWNRYVLCGQPVIGNPQASVIYPTTALLRLMPVTAFFAVNYVLHLTFAGLGAYLFARRLCGDRLSGLLAALTFVGSGFVMARLQFPTMIQAMAYLPWLFMLADRLIERPGVGYAALLAAAVALQILAGHAQLAYMSFLAASVYFLVRLWRARCHRDRARTALMMGVAGFTLGLLATGAQLLPMLQLFVLSTREELTWAQANRFALRWGDLIHYIAPYWHGDPARGDFWGSGNLWESCVYIGIPSLALAGYGLWRSRRRRTAVFFGAFALLSIWLALGKFGGIYWVAFYVAPGLASFHDPARFTFITTFALSVLAGMGLRALRDRGWPNPARVSLLAVAALNLWAFSAHLNPTIAPSAFEYRPRFMATAPPSPHGRVFSAERSRVWDRYLNYSDYGPDSARYVHELTDTASPNILMRFGVEEASGYEPVPVKSVTELDSLVRAALKRRSPQLPALLGLLNAHALLLPEMARYSHPGLSESQAPGMTVLTLRDPLPRAWLVRRAVRVDGSKRALAAMSARDFDPRRNAIVSGAAEFDEQTSAGGSAPVAIRAFSSRTLSLQVDCGSAAGYLVLSETWYPGWAVTVDGRPARMDRANHAFRGIRLSAGPHLVQFEFRPSSFRIGLFLTLVSCAAVAAGMTAGLLFRFVQRSRDATSRGNMRARV